AAVELGWLDFNPKLRQSPRHQARARTNEWAELPYQRFVLRRPRDRFLFINIHPIILHNCLLSDLDAAFAFYRWALRDGFGILSDFCRLLICIKRIGGLIFVQVELLDGGLLPFSVSRRVRRRTRKVGRSVRSSLSDVSASLAWKPRSRCRLARMIGLCVRGIELFRGANRSHWRNKL